MSFCQIIYFYYVYTSTGYGEYLIYEAVFSISLNFISQFYCISISSSLGTLTTYVILNILQVCMYAGICVSHNGMILCGALQSLQY